MILKKTSAAGLVVLILSICCVCDTAFAEGHWVGTWACSQQLVADTSKPPEPWLANNTLRQVVHTSLGGGRIRVQFSNKYSPSAITINGAHVALSTGGVTIDPNTDAALSFGGLASVTINAGQEVYSDGVDFNVKPLSDLTVSIWFGTAASTNVTGHTLSMASSYIGWGNRLSSANPYVNGTTHWYILSGVDVWRDDSQACVVALGDSITDGAASTTNGNNRWPDDLAKRLHADPSTAKIGVLNQGISGNMVVSGGTGPSATARFDHDVLGQSGIRWLIILEGINDIGNSSTPATTANNIIAAYEQFIIKAHAQNIAVYGATLTPFKGSGYSNGNAARLDAWQTVNNWIRTSGKFDAVIDMAAAICDPADPNKMLAIYDSGDHLHPSVAGLQKMADTVDVNLFQQRAGDLNKNGIVDSVDFAVLAGQWQQAPGLPSADIEPPVGDGAVDFTDFYLMAQEWLDVNLFQQNAADLNNDGIVNFADFAVLARQWQQAPGLHSADIAPPVGDGTVDFADFYPMAQEWLMIW
jgi:lysophospholipase L1-like esterase